QPPAALRPTSVGGFRSGAPFSFRARRGAVDRRHFRARPAALRGGRRAPRSGAPDRPLVPDLLQPGGPALQPPAPGGARRELLLDCPPAALGRSRSADRPCRGLRPRRSRLLLPPPLRGGPCFLSGAARVPLQPASARRPRHLGGRSRRLRPRDGLPAAAAAALRVLGLDRAARLPFGDRVPEIPLQLLAHPGGRGPGPRAP